MKVLALTRTSSIGPSTRYRIEQYRPALAADGGPARHVHRGQQARSQTHVERDDVRQVEQAVG